MKKFFAGAIGLLAFVAIAAAEDVAVMKIQFGKSKPFKTVVISLDEQAAPKTVENFKKLAKKGFYDGVEFHRAFPGTLVQTGDPGTRGGVRKGAGTGGPGYTLPAEINAKHHEGAVAMGRLPDNVNPARHSSGSQFFIVVKTMPEYDGKYTVFGTVIIGLDIIDQISRKPTDSNDYPNERIRIRSLRIVPREQAGS